MWKKDGEPITKALVGDEVYLCADVRDIAEGTTAKIKIVEKDDDGNDDEVESPNTKVQNGKIKCKWKVVYMEDNDDAESQQEQEEKGYTLPEYAFTIECDGEKSGESPRLNVRGWINIKFNEDDEAILKYFLLYLYCDEFVTDSLSLDCGQVQFKNLPLLSKEKKWKIGVKK